MRKIFCGKKKKQILGETDCQKSNGQYDGRIRFPTLSAQNAERMGHPMWWLALVGFAEFGDYLEVFEGGGVAFDFAAGG